jgi:hypothetical protein
MSRSDSNALEAALVLVAVILALFLAVGLVGCVGASGLHSWGDGKSPWIDYSDECADNCAI